MKKQSLKEKTILHNKYIIEKCIGTGGFGITYLVKSQINGKNYAIKEFYPSDFAYREEFTNSNNIRVVPDKVEFFQKEKARCLQEAKVLSELSYLDGIVEFIESFQENNTVYLVMQYIDGITLKDYLSYNGTFNYKEIVLHLKPILTSLARMHKRGYVHRDISPDNIMIGTDNKFYLIDFGATWIDNSRFESDEEYTKSQTVILKNGYAPPEQYIKDGNTGSWSDVYAISALIYMAISGVRPVESIARLQGRSLSSLMALTNTSASNSSQNIDILKSISKNQNNSKQILLEWQENVIMKGMSLDISDRYKDAGELLDALLVDPYEYNHTPAPGYNRPKNNNMKQPSKPSKSSNINYTPNPNQASKNKSNNRKKAILIVIPVVIILVVIGILIAKNMNSKESENVVSTGSNSTDNSQDDSNSNNSIFNWNGNKDNSSSENDTDENSGDNTSSEDSNSENDTGSEGENSDSTTDSENSDNSSEENVVETVTMISVKNKSLSSAKKKIKKLDNSIKIKVVKKYNSNYKKGKVYQQSIVKNTTFNKGSLK
ncbi:MAG: protein kinase, partial [Lachnospiraceae bacterium]|nr:protein kinase [Lachnospiraceae bacterium]